MDVSPAAYCESTAFRSCECLKRCRDWFCPKDSQGREWCHCESAGAGRRAPALQGSGTGVPSPNAARQYGCAPADGRFLWGRPCYACQPSPPCRNPRAGFFPPADRKCFRREGVPPDQQFSLAPGPDEQVKCFSGYLDGAEEVPCRWAGRAQPAAGCITTAAGGLRTASSAAQHGLTPCFRRQGAYGAAVASSLACSEAAIRETPWEKTASLPLAECPEQCNMRG